MDRQYVDIRNIRRRQLEVLVKLGTADQQGVGQPQRRKAGDQRLRLGLGQLQIVDDDQVRRLGFGRKSVLQPKGAHLLRQVMLMAAHDRAMRLAAAAKLRSACRMVTGAARTLLLVHLGAGAGHFGTALGLVGALLALSQLPAHDALQDVLARVEAENALGEFHLAGFLAGKRRDLDIHYSAPSVAGASFLAAPARIAAGFGALAGSAIFAASRTRIHAPFEPGTAPRIRIRPRSASVETISTFCVVTRVSPMWPAIFLPLNTLPGSWRWPVEPCERCDTELPWEARPPPMLWRFMTPWKPLPTVVPVTSTFWPGTKCSTVISAPTSIMLSAETRNSATFALGSTDAVAKWPRSAFDVFFTLARPTPSWTAV